MLEVAKLHHSKTLAIYADLRDPLSDSKIHPEWCKQFIYTVYNQKVHSILESKLKKFGRIGIFYTKIKYDYEKFFNDQDFDGCKIFVISSVGEHSTTPWMMIHNIAHTIFSWRSDVKRELTRIAGFENRNNVNIIPIQTDLVTSTASKRGLIPNINEILYELFTTWVWCGHTKSKNQEIREYCDNLFEETMQKVGTIWHKYRHPVDVVDAKWLRELLYSE